jgi:hypothetical protein
MVFENFHRLLYIVENLEYLRLKLVETKKENRKMKDLCTASFTDHNFF